MFNKHTQYNYHIKRMGRKIMKQRPLRFYDKGWINTNCIGKIPYNDITCDIILKDSNIIDIKNITIFCVKQHIVYPNIMRHSNYPRQCGYDNYTKCFQR